MQKNRSWENIRKWYEHYEKIISTKHRHTQEAPQKIKPRRWATRIAHQPTSEPNSAQIDANLGTKQSKRRPKSMPTSTQIEAEQIEAYKFHKKQYGNHKKTTPKKTTTPNTPQKIKPRRSKPTRETTRKMRESIHPKRSKKIDESNCGHNKKSPPGTILAN